MNQGGGDERPQEKGVGDRRPKEKGRVTSAQKEKGRATSAHPSFKRPLTTASFDYFAQRTLRTRTYAPPATSPGAPTIENPFHTPPDVLDSL